MEPHIHSLRFRFLPQFLLGSLVFLAPVVAFAAEMVTVTDVTGQQVAGNLKSWSADHVVISSEDDEHSFLPIDVQSVTFDRPDRDRKQAQTSLWLTNGDRLSARSVSVQEETLSMSWPALSDGELTSVPLEDIAAMIFEWPQTVRERLRLIADLESLPAGSDLVMLSNGDRSFGEFQRLDAAFVELKVGGKVLKLDRSRVRAIRLDPELATRTRPSGRRTILTLNDGSQLTVSHLKVMDGLVHAKSSLLDELTLPVAMISACHMFGHRIIPISDYVPAKVEFTPYLSSKWSLVRNANVLQGPLSILGNEFVTGLGMHSRMSVTYELHGDEREFRALVGIDDVANGQGSARFVVELDGHRIWSSPEMTGKSPAKSTQNLSVQGGKKLTLIVDFGEFADVADYANWCDALLILDAPRD